MCKEVDIRADCVVQVFLEIGIRYLISFLKLTVILAILLNCIIGQVCK